MKTIYDLQPGDILYRFDEYSYKIKEEVFKSYDMLDCGNCSELLTTDSFSFVDTYETFFKSYNYPKRYFFTTLEEAQESADNKALDLIYELHDNIEYNNKLL